MMQRLGARGLTRVLCEGGGRLAAALIEDDLVDEMVCYTAGWCSAPRRSRRSARSRSPRCSSRRASAWWTCRRSVPTCGAAAPAGVAERKARALEPRPSRGTVGSRPTPAAVVGSLRPPGRDRFNPPSRPAAAGGRNRSARARRRAGSASRSGRCRRGAFQRRADLVDRAAHVRGHQRAVGADPRRVPAVEGGHGLARRQQAALDELAEGDARLGPLATSSRARPRRRAAGRRRCVPGRPRGRAARARCR